MSLSEYLDSQLTHGRAHFTGEEGAAALGRTSEAFSTAAARLIKKRRLVRPKRGFYLILRPEDRPLGAPDPARWIDPLMNHLGLDYRVSVLRAASFHGSSHQAAMVFQVIAPKQLRGLAVGRQRLQFIYQAPAVFARTNRSEWLDRMKTDAGYAKVAGVELTLLDSVRYFHKAAGIGGVAQVAHDLGQRARPRMLIAAAECFENSAVRRLGYLLEYFGHKRQATALLPFAEEAKSIKPLDPSVKPLAKALEHRHETNSTWKLLINTPVEIDA